MFYKDAKCDIYIGKGAGKKLMEDIHAAKLSVKVVSPYLSASLVEALIKLHHKQIHIMLVTADDITEFSGKYARNLKQLFIQHKEIDHRAMKIKNLLKKIFWLLFLFLAVYSAFFSVIYSEQPVKNYWGFLPIGFLLLLIILVTKAIIGKKTHYFRYSQLFPFKAFLSSKTTKNRSDALMHSKIFIIDGEIAYLGSLNFTASGTKFNHETCVRTINKSTVIEINQEVNRLMNEPDFPERDIQAWGRKVYEYEQ